MREMVARGVQVARSKTHAPPCCSRRVLGAVAPAAEGLVVPELAGVGAAVTEVHGQVRGAPAPDASALVPRDHDLSEAPPPARVPSVRPLLRVPACVLPCGTARTAAVRSTSVSQLPAAEANATKWTHDDRPVVAAKLGDDLVKVGAGKRDGDSEVDHPSGRWVFDRALVASVYVESVGVEVPDPIPAEAFPVLGLVCSNDAVVDGPPSPPWRSAWSSRRRATRS